MTTATSLLWPVTMFQQGGPSFGSWPTSVSEGGTWSPPPWWGPRIDEHYLLPGEVWAWIETPEQPRPQGNHKNVVSIPTKGGGRFTKLVASKPEQRYRKALVAALAASSPAPFPITVPVELDLVVDLKPPAGWPSTLRRAAQDRRGAPPPVRGAHEGTGLIPDRCNLAKMVEDALTLSGWLADDSQTVSGVLAKRWAHVTGYHLRIRPVTC